MGEVLSPLVLRSPEPSSGIVTLEERPGWALPCPGCDRSIPYTVLNLKVGRNLFLYSDTTADFLLLDTELDFQGEVTVSGPDEEYATLRAILDSVERTIGLCPAGGGFRFRANVRCPHCRWGFPYNQGVKNDWLRCFDSKVIWVEGATAFRGAWTPSNQLGRVIVRPG